MTRLPAFLCMLALAFPAKALIAPWYSLQKKMQQTIGANPNVTVSPLIGSGSQFTIEVHCATRSLARAHAFILEKEHYFGNIRVAVRVLDDRDQFVDGQNISCGTNPLQTAQDYFRQALEFNPYFVRFSRTLTSPLAVEIKADVVQVANDNTSNPYGLSTFVAAEAFDEVIKNQFCNPAFSVIIASAPKAP